MKVILHKQHDEATCETLSPKTGFSHFQAAFSQFWLLVLVLVPAYRLYIKLYAAVFSKQAKTELASYLKQ